jgi:arginine decarboxylase
LIVDENPAARKAAALAAASSAASAATPATAASGPQGNGAAAASARPPLGRPSTRVIEKNREYYDIAAWGAGFFDADDEGYLTVRPSPHSADRARLSVIVQQAIARGARTPMLIRFPQLLEARVAALNDAFRHAIAEHGYKGEYRGVYPIKVNQDPEVLYRISRCGQRYGYGLEVGSKAELLVALAQPLAQGALVICNGYKDQAYIDLALAGAAAGRPVVLIAEKFREVVDIVQAAEKDKTRAMLGIRLKVASKGAGRWEKSSGPLAKFGLTVQEMLQAVQFLEQRGSQDLLRVLHFHVGSQVTDIRRIREAVREGARAYAKLKKRGLGVRVVDVGGGLGVDYDGSKTNFDSSVNYDLQEYCNTVVYTIQETCAEEEVETPDITSESGRAIAAYHSVLVTEVLEQVGGPPTEEAPKVADQHQLVDQLEEVLEGLSPRNYREAFHDAGDIMDEVNSLFRLGYLSLEERARAEWLCSTVFDRCIRIAQKEREFPEELQELRDKLATRYVCNFSIFQSLPDHWTVDQLFPIVPLSRHDEEPTVPCTLGDITCDSDGKIERFIDRRDVKDSVNFHPLRDGERYYLGCFLVGAYQDVLGDFHNLFGATDEVVALIGEGGEIKIKRVNTGDDLQTVIGRFGYRPAALQASFESWVERGRESEELTEEEVEQVVEVYRDALQEYTYLRVPPRGGKG